MGMTTVISLLDLIKPQAEQTHWQWQLRFEFFAFWVELEVFEVVPAVEDQEHILFKAPRLEFAGFQQARAAPDHLPKLGVGIDWLGEHKVDDFTYINTGV